MRSLMLLAIVAAVGCAHRPPQLVTRDGAATLAEFLRRHPIAPSANIRADEIDRTAAATIHLVQVRGGETPHRHVAHDLTITVVQGEGVLTLDGTPRELNAGDAAVIPRGVAHFFVNRGRMPAVALVVFAPPLDAPDNVPVGGVDSPPVAR
jgi:quercetin dioxygenase-like cupin family protein